MIRKIVLTIDNDKNIYVRRDGEYCLVISSNKRQINAKDIYDLFAYSKGTTYEIDLINPEQQDKLVLEEFFSLLTEIKEQLEALNDEFLN